MSVSVDKREIYMSRRITGAVLLCMFTVSLPVGVALAGVMSTPVQFRVNETGAATFSLPIQVPPGTAGLEPKLSLRYNSRDGNGLAGMGAGVGGIAVITRCPRTRAQDGGMQSGLNLDAEDGFCIDGQRLFAVSGRYGASGTEYRTELANFSKIVSYASTLACYGGMTVLCDDLSPGWFKVWTKSG
jgi:hypothetical protein